MGNTNSSPRYRSRSPDPSSLEQTWNNSYPKVERERNRSAWQQHAQQPNPSKHLSGYPSSGANVMVNGHLNAHYDQFEQECIQHQQQQQPKMADQQPLRFARYGPGVGEAPVQQAKKIRVLPMAANGATGNAAVNAVKLRATDNGLALQKVGTLHVANRKLNELNHNLMAANCEPPIVATLIGNGADEMRSPTPDYDANNKQRSSSGSRKPSKSKRNSKAKAPNTAPSTPAASAKSGSSSRVDQEQQQPAGGSKSSGRGKLRLFKTKSTDGKAADSESGRIRARSMEYLRADVADETQEVRRGGRHNTSREDLSGDESLLAFIRNGPVTVFSSQKKLNGTMTDDDDWEEMHPESSSFSRVPPQSEQPASSSSSSGNNNNHNNNHNNNNSKPQQFYFGMAPGDVSAPPTGVPAAAASQSVDLDEESRRVMEEFDAVLAENKSVIDRKSETEEKEDGGRLRQSIRRPAKSTSSSASSDQRRRHSSTPPPVIRHHSSTRRATLHEDQLDHDDDYDQDIALSLRPTLPKKPQQLPRFSPSAAWRALGQSSDHHFHARSSSISSVSNKLNASSSKASDMSAMDLSDEEDEDEDVMEERIAKNALRPVAPHLPRISNEKSADSGISGDAGSPDGAAMVASGGGASGRDKPLAMSSPVPPQQQRNQLQNNWTPQQDLLDDDSSNNGSSEDEAGHNVQRRSRGGGSSCFRASKRHPSTADPTPPKIIPKSQMFNDSSMTDQTADSRSSSMSKGGRKYRKRNETGGSSSRTGDEGAPGAGAHCIPQKYNSLRKLKRSVSGAFATAFRRGKCSPSDDDNEDETNMRRNSHHASGHHCDDGNWMLSRSAPNSVLNGSGGDDDGSYPSIRKLQSRSEADLLAQQHHGFGQLGHQYPAYSQPSVLSTQRIVYLPQYDSRIVSAHQRQPRLGRPASMDQTDMMRRARSADAVFLEAKKQSVGQRLFGHGHGHSPNKKFTFQSTVRVHEKRLLEEKLSREAEQKERKRLQETLAMQRVEEEFQRKRAREKANIRQQLRVLQLDHYKHQEQLMILREQQHHQQQRIARLDPEGAPSSISHQRTSSDELPIQQQSMPVKKSANARLAEAETRDKRKEATPPAATSSSALQQLRNNRSASSNIRSDDVVDSPKKKTHQPQMDYRREVINSSRSRSAATPSTPSANPSAVSSDAGRFPDRQTRANNNADRGVHNNINNNNSTAAVVAAQQKKKSNSNIYRRLAEITSEEESISSPPPVSSLMARSASSNASAMNKQQQQPPSVGAAAHSRVPSSSAAAAAAQHVVSNANGNPSNGGNKVMTQELSEYRQERREYHDFRSPRLHQQQLIASPGRFYGAGQPSGHRVLPTSAASSSTSSMSNNKMQSDNYRWDFAHGGRGVHHMAGHPSGQPSVAKSTPTPPSVATWHHHHQAQLLQQKPSQVFSSRQQHDYHHHHQFYKLASPTTDVVMMHRTPQQRHH